MRHLHTQSWRRYVWGVALVGIGGLTVLTVWLWSSPRPPDGQAPTPITPAHQAHTTTSTETTTIRFTDVTERAGIAFTHFAGATGNKWYPETIGAGAAFLDYDGDGWPDILLVNGMSLSASPANGAGHVEPTMHLYRNRGDGTFENVTKQAGLDVPVYGMGVAVGDYDNDGDSDVVVTGYQRNLLFRNNGNGTFTEVSQQTGIRGGAWGSGAAFFDYDRDGHLDLVISHYVEWTPELEQGLDCTYGTPSKDYCPVRYFRGQGLVLYRNRGDGTFEETTDQAGVRSSGSRAFAPYVFDFDDDQWPDLFVASDGTPSLVYRNRGDGSFEEVGVRSGIVLDARGGAYAGMGIDGTYPTHDAQLCIAIGNFVGEPTTLHCRVRDGTSYHPELYAEVSAWAGIGRPTLQSVTFGLFFFDADLDGYEDLFMVNGHVVDEARLRQAPRAQRPQLFRNLGNGQFQEIVPTSETGLDIRLVGRAAAYADYDGDGDLDILISQNQGPAVLLRNDTLPHGHFLRVHLRGTSSNRDGIGAMVRVHAGGQMRQQMLRSGRSYYSQHEQTLTFGLGAVTTVERVEILWPSGIIDILDNVAIDATLHAVEGGHATEARAQVLPPADKAQTTGNIPTTETLPDVATNQAFLQSIQAGMRAYHAQQYSEAAQAFVAARQLRPGDPLPHRYLVDLYWRQGEHAQARTEARWLADVLPDAYFFDRLGSSYEAIGMSGLAMVLYREAVRISPDFPSARYNLGRMYLENGVLDAGIAEVQHALQFYPDFAMAHQTLAMAFAAQGRLDLAMTHVQRALTIQPDLTEARNHLGRLYTAQQRFDEAVHVFQTLIRDEPRLAEARHNLAVAYARMGRREQAVTQFRKVVELRPDLYAAQIDLGTLLLEMQRPEEAVQTFQSILHAVSQTTKLQEDIDIVEIKYRLSIAQLIAGQPQQAVETLHAVLTSQPQHAAAHMYLGRAYLETKQYDRAWKHARHAEALGAPVADLIAALTRVSVESQ